MVFGDIGILLEQIGANCNSSFLVINFCSTKKVTKKKKKKLQEYPCFWLASMFWYVLFQKSLIAALDHCDNALLFYFNVKIQLGVMCELDFQRSFSW